MTKTALCAAAVLALAAVAAGAHADTVVLQDEVYVKGPDIHLGDVADIDGRMRGALERVVVASAATPGSSRRFNASLVRSRVRNAGIDCAELEFKGATTVHATTLSTAISAHEIAESLRLFIETEMPWAPCDTEILVTPPTSAVTVPEGAVEFAWRPNPQYAYIGGGAFRGEVRVDGRLVHSLLCKAEVEPYVEVVVAVSDITRGQLLTPHCLELQKRPITAAKNGAFERFEELDGMVARSTIFPGEILTPRDAEPRTVIKRNQIVRVEARAGALLLQSRAKACSDACEGEFVFCENLDSGESFQGVAQADGRVVVY